LAKKLKEIGIDAVSVIEIMKGAEDIEVMERAKRENRIIITNDKDFGWLALTHKPPGIILLRLKKETLENKTRLTTYILQKYQSSLYGKMIIATEKKIRMKSI